jgi:hypothetical protein
MPLLNIFPIFSRYNHCQLSLLGLHVEIDDLILFHCAFSPIIRRVELQDLSIRPRHMDCNWETALQRITLYYSLIRKKRIITSGLVPLGKRVWIWDLGRIVLTAVQIRPRRKAAGQSMKAPLGW